MKAVTVMNRLLGLPDIAHAPKRLFSWFLLLPARLYLLHVKLPRELKMETHIPVQDHSDAVIAWIRKDLATLHANGEITWEELKRRGGLERD